MLSFYVDPKQLDLDDFFPADVGHYVAFFKSARPIEAGGEVLVPGEPEIRVRKKRLAEGIPLPDETWTSLVAAARKTGLDEQRIQTARPDRVPR
jgi:uncharacterized oxidoreductase